MTGSDDPGRLSRQGRVVRELTAVHRLTETRLNRSLRPLGLTLTQVTVLTQLIGRPEGVSVGRLAELMEINQPGVSKILTTLAAGGAVEVTAVAGDGRRRVARLTPAGWQLIVAARTAMHPEATEILGDLDDASLDALHDLLVVVRTRLTAGSQG